MFVGPLASENVSVGRKSISYVMGFEEGAILDDHYPWLVFRVMGILADNVFHGL